MSSALISRSPDLSRLQNEGYELNVVGARLVVHHVPYVTASRTVEFGSLVCDLTLSGDRTAKPQTHVMHFSGQMPCHKDGTPIRAIQHSEAPQELAPGLQVQRSFSNKPPGGYADYYSMVSRYVEILSAPAAALDPSATARTFKPIPEADADSVFTYVDTNSERAQISTIAAKLQGQRIAIVGLGGTGSYVLDLVAKTPVAEIRLFDADNFLQHNAFRAPGAPSLEQLNESPAKVDYLARIYSRMHKGIRPYRERLDGTNLCHLDGLHFVFLCMDSGQTKKQIVGELVSKQIPFTDAGIGIQQSDHHLLGILRVTTNTAEKHDHLEKRISFAEPDDDAYSTNVQIAELNMLNAALSVIKWKKLAGFYLDAEHEHHTTYSIDGGMLLNEDIQA